MPHRVHLAYLMPWKESLVSLGLAATSVKRGLSCVRAIARGGRHERRLTRGSIVKRLLIGLAAVGLANVCIATAAVAARHSSSAPPLVKAALNKHLKRPIVVDAAGRTLYMFTVDPRNFATCVGNQPARDCGKVWPPLVTTGAPVAGRGSMPTCSGRRRAAPASSRSPTTDIRCTTSAATSGRRRTGSRATPTARRSTASGTS
jgi:predicted lipoprotein with Yx(FWY)xxD motif